MIGSGTHMMVDAYTSMSFTTTYIESFLRDMISLVGMRAILGPFVQGERNVWDGWCVLAESHAAIHVHGGECHIDLFSCRWFDAGIPLELIRQRLKLSQMKVVVLERPMPDPIGGRDD